VSHVNSEMVDMHHNMTNTPDDGLNETFDDDSEDHWGFDAGPTTIAADLCNYSINPWINDSAATGSQFEEILLHDGSNEIIYTSKVEQNLYGYRNDSSSKYDFQMIVAENASASGLQTDYYFMLSYSKNESIIRVD